MMTLARVVADHPHAVQRELLCHNRRFEDFGEPDAKPMAVRHFVSFVIAAPPMSSLGQAVNEGWTHTDQLIANLAEQHAGLIALQHRYPRPGVDSSPVTGLAASAGQEPDTGHVTEQHAINAVAAGAQLEKFDTPDAFEARLAAFRAKVKPKQQQQEEVSAA
jgi:hypothetical protein